MKVLFLVPWPTNAASTRLRVAQYFPYLRAHGVEPILRPFMTERLYGVVYQQGHLVDKTFHFARCFARRLQDILLAAKMDLVFIHREAFPFGTTFIEQVIARTGVPMVLDFDDAIYLPSNSRANGLVGRLKRPGKVADLLRLSRSVVVGNNHLSAYATQFNENVVVVPTPVDTARFRPYATLAEQHGDSRRVVVGWIGSGTTARYLRGVAEPLHRLTQRYPEVQVHVMGGVDPSLRDVPIQIIRWSLATEVDALRAFDIGIMPYPDDDWARGKCAHKALLYMSMGIPAVCSPVGMANEIITNGQTGFLADSANQWFDTLASLVESGALRQQMGARGRALVEAEFSIDAQAPRLLSVLRATANRASVAAAAQRGPVPGR